MVEPLKRPWSPISTASDTAVRADRAKAGQTPGGGGGARRRRGRPAMASSSRSRRAVACTTVPAGRASSGAPAHWAPCRSRGRGGHAAPRAPAGSGFRAPGAVIDDPAAQQHPGAGGGGRSSGRRGHPGRERTRSRAPSWQAGAGPAPRAISSLRARRASRIAHRAIGPGPLAARAQQLGGRRHLAGDPAPRPGPRARSKPVGPASQRRLDVPVPRPQAGDQRHDLAGITGHRPLNQPASVSVSIAAALMERARASSPRLLRSVNTGASYACRHPDPLTVANDPRGCIRQAPARKPSDPTPIWSEISTPGARRGRRGAPRRRTARARPGTRPGPAPPSAPPDRGGSAPSAPVRAGCRRWRRSPARPAPA